jgi:hypothetical protein
MTTVRTRIKIENEICTAVVDALLAAGFAIAVDNGDEESKPTTDRAAILEGMFQTDQEHLYAYAGNGKFFGWVFLEYGNDGYDVISDYTVNLDSLIGQGTAVDKIVESYA